MRNTNAPDAAATFRRLCATQTDDCVEWPHARNRHGYGLIRHEGRSTLTHRLALTLIDPPPAPGLSAIHSCDNPPCMNIRHLRWGTHDENMAEARDRSLLRTGDRHPMAKLTESQVQMIRDALEAGQTGRSLARLYGVSEGTISMIRNGQRWIRRYPPSR